MNNLVYKVFAIIGLVLLLIVGAFFVFFYSWSSDEMIIETSTPETIISDVRIDADGHKVYSNSTYNYQFKFPADWKFAEYDGGVVAVDPQKVLSPEEFHTLDLPAGGFTIRVEDHFSYIVGYESFSTTKIGPDNISAKYYKQVNGSNADNPISKNATSYSYYVPFPDSEDEGVIIRIFYPNNSANIAAYNKVLSTFRFTNTIQSYENEYMKIAIPVGWTAKEATQKNSYGTCIDKEACTVEEKIEPNPAAVNITKGNYILYINAQASQASGVEGGRFVEYAGGAPSVEAVITEWPSEPCYGSAQATSMIIVNGISMKRTDLFVGARDTAEYCRKPTSGTVWYFSYIGSGINYFDEKLAGLDGWVISMAYNSRDVNLLPKKGSAELNAMLAEMSSIVKTLEFK